MADPSYIVFSPSDVTGVGMKASNNTWTGTNTFSEPVVITKAIGTAPLTITSTTKVANLNVEQVDGADTGTSGATIPLLNGNNTHSGNNSFTGTNKFGDSSNYVQIDGSGEMSFVGTSTVWDDLRVDATATKLGGSKDPGFAKFKDNGSGSQGVFIYWFDAASEEEVYFSVQMPHSWDGSAIYPHIHTVPKTTADPTSETFEFGLEYTWANINGTYGNSSIVYAKSGTSLTAGKHTMVSFDAITPGAGTQDGISSMMICRLFRNATDGTDDTYDDDVGLLEFDIHYRINTIGSKTETAK